MVTFLQLLVSGIGMGCIYCMVAIEYTLIWNASGLVNFGHEKFIMLGAYIFAGTLMLKLGVPSGAAILITILIMFLFGALTAVGVFNPLSRLNSNIFAVMGTLMLSEVLNEAARLIWGPAPFNLPDFIKGSYNVGGVSIPKVYAVIVVVSMLLLVSIHLMFKMTKVGRAMRCVAQDKKAAALMGINVNANIMLTVGLSAAICCIIGILIIPILNVKLTMASVIALKGFSAGIVGGFGSIPGAIVGGLLIGIVESLYTGVGPSVYRDVVAFVLVKPEGILKKKTVNR